MNQKSLLLSTILITMSLGFSIADDKKKSVHEFSVKDIKGKDVSLADYKGKVLMIVNVASRCGATPQYEALQNLNTKYGKKGLVVLGFPANNFGKQEPGSNKEILEFCTSTYQVSFPMFAKVSVKGDDKDPLFKHLTAAKNQDKAGDISWNFEKFLVGKDGKLQRRFKTGVKPDDTSVVTAIEKALAE